MNKFEIIDSYPDAKLPERATAGAAGYDFYVAEDTLVPSYLKMFKNVDTTSALCLGEVAYLTKTLETKPTLVPTGVKCKLDNGTFLQLSVRSSCPLKYWLILANGVGIIDSDYYGNEDNDGHIFFQLINLSPFDIKLQKGDRIGQGIIMPYMITDDDSAAACRTGGFGST